MARKKNKSMPVFHMSGEEATLAHMPKYNGYACGYGTHGKTGYCREDEKKKLRRDIAEY